MLNIIPPGVREFLLSSEVQYSFLIFILFVFPRFLVRLGIPFALSAFFLGIGANLLNWDLSHGETVKLLSSFGIISLFLFAGLEVDFDELRGTRRFLIQHLAIRVALIVLATLGLNFGLGVGTRASAILALAILTPSTGFILDTLELSTVTEESKFWIRSKAIAAEIIALILMFAVVRSFEVSEFLTAMIGLALLIVALPFIFKFFVRTLEPVAPKSEFGFLIMLALIAGMVTKKLGAYYLIGAFVVGVVARRFEASTPRLTSKSLLKSVKAFSGFFVPFYFFAAGSGVTTDELTFHALLVGSAMLVVFVPIRLVSVIWHRKFALKEPSQQSLPVATLLLPNLVFGLVLADLLKNQFHAPAFIVGALIIYTVGVTIIPPLLLRIFWREKPEYSYLADLENRLGGGSWTENEMGGRLP